MFFWGRKKVDPIIRIILVLLLSNVNLSRDVVRENRGRGGLSLLSQKPTPLDRGVARLSTSGGQERNISSIFLILLLFSPIFPQFFLIFFLNLVLRVGSSPTREGPGYATASWAPKWNDTFYRGLWRAAILSPGQPPPPPPCPVILKRLAMPQLMRHLKTDIIEFEHGHKRQLLSRSTIFMVYLLYITCKALIWKNAFDW